MQNRPETAVIAPPATVPATAQAHPAPRLAEGGGGSSPAADGPGPAHPAMDNFRERGFTVVEAELPARLGIQRELIRTLREQLLTKGRHWERAHRDIVLTEEAVEILLTGHSALKKAAPTNGSAQPETTQPPSTNLAYNENGAAGEAAKTAVELRVARTFPYNPLLIEAHPPGRPEERVRVRVQQSQNYCRGMVIYARHIERNLYQLEGRAPRFRGERLYRGEMENAE